jgi:hypothetical protein
VLRPAQNQRPSYSQLLLLPWKWKNSLGWTSSCIQMIESHGWPEDDISITKLVIDVLLHPWL